jgi:xanthine dehydrogenase accessory factor
MRDVLDVITKLRAEGRALALATVVYTGGSAPRQPGARLVVSDEGEMAGSVSGGCVESDVVYQAQEVLQGGEPRLVRYAISDDMVWEVGLACGGTVEVWIEAVADPAADPLQAELESAVADGRTIAHAILLKGPGHPGARMLIQPSGAPLGSLGDSDLDQQVVADALRQMSRSRATTQAYAQPQARVFLETLLPPPHLVIFGGVHAAIPLTTFAKTLGYRVTIVDPRSQFASRERFPDADAIIPQWPDKAIEQLEIGPATLCVILTHDPKIDEPALANLLGKGAGYIGAIGSSKTHAERFTRMAKTGVDPQLLAEVFAPIGLDLGAESPEEIALAIMAEIVAVRHDAPAGYMRHKAQKERSATPSS